MQKKLFFRNALIILHIIFALVGFVVYISNYRLSEKYLLQDSLNNQLLLASAGSSSVQNLFAAVQNELSSFIFSFVQVNPTLPIDLPTTRTAFLSYMHRAQLPVNGIAYYDENGILRIIENRFDIRVGEGQDFSQTPLILWSKNPLNKDKVFISTPYIGTTGASVGKIIFVMAKPMYLGNTYRGTLSIRLLVNDFGKAYVTPLTSSKSESSFVISKKGVLLAGDKGLINQNLFAYAKKQHWKGYQTFVTALTKALTTNTTSTVVQFAYPSQKVQTYIVGISKIDVPNTDDDVYMVVLTPKTATLASLGPVKGYGLAWLGFGVFVTIVGSIIVLLLQTF